MTRRHQSKRRRSKQSQRSRRAHPPTVARLAFTVQKLAKRVRRLEHRRRQIGFRRDEVVDVEAVSGDFVIEQDEGEET